MKSKKMAKMEKERELSDTAKRIPEEANARLERFVREYADQGFQFAVRLCGNTEEAKELVQEAFYRVLRHWESYDPAQSLENWFLTILRNVYYDGSSVANVAVECRFILRSPPRMERRA